jgi:(p)ppGpp synthase/HD superfamily hydrolase
MTEYWNDESDKYNLYEEISESHALYLLALKIANEAHKNQVDKGGTPYINHPIEVAKNMDTNEEKIVALLHDVIEDTDVTLEQLKETGFPLEVLAAIDAITKRNNEEYGQYLDRLIKNKYATKVKIQDMVHNSDISRIPNPTDKDFERVDKYTEKIKQLKAYL